ncbi:MAG: protein-glutamate O-methyltransferase CheR [Gemmatimonadaceae bacterium]
MPVEPLADEPQLAALCKKIERDRGFFCSSYKDTCVRRRISVRMRIKGAATFEEYGFLLDDDPHEYDRLMGTLTINVSKFFRNPETFASIATKVIPDLAASAVPLIRVWSAGCASGEEPYSLAVLCHEYLESQGEKKRGLRFEIVGTDVDADAIAAARRGRYGEAAFTETTPAVRDTYFPLSDGLHTASDQLRSLVAFHKSDILDGSKAVSRFHLILCRNVIIYFKRETQQWLFERFHELLLPGGFLVLGKVESLIGKSRELFVPISARQRIYRRA